jgi:hypothetical protein
MLVDSREVTTRVVIAKNKPKLVQRIGKFMRSVAAVTALRTKHK